MSDNQKEIQVNVPANVSIIDNVNLQQISATMAKISQFQAVVKSTLKEGHDYGVIPGTGSKPTLLKPGAEKILMLMGLSSEYEVIEKVQDYERGFFAFTVKCTLYKNGLKITEGIGHANTKEARYARRWVTESKLPEGIDKDSLPKREKEGKYGKYIEYQIGNDDPYTLANTVLKMAKKRAQVDAVLTVASLSEIFTQDIEDFVDDIPSNNQPSPQHFHQQQHNQQSNSNEQMATEAQIKAIHTLAKKKEIDLGDLLRSLYGVESTKELTKAQASELIDGLQKLQPSGE